MSQPAVLAIVAHPDDIEFMMAGTLLLLKAAGYRVHYLNVASGSCGSLTENAVRTRVRRAKEARAAAAILGAKFHPSLVDDLEIFYEPKLLRRIAAVVREVRPSIVLTHAGDDYMEDHMNTARLAVTAAFVRGMPNFVTTPKRKAIGGDVTVYHAMPHGLRNSMGKRVSAETYVDVSSVHEVKLAALSAHRSQQGWLDATQKMNSYLAEMERMSREVGKLSGKFTLAEGWRRHYPVGLGRPEADPLREALVGKCRVNPAYLRWLETPFPGA